MLPLRLRVSLFNHRGAQGAEYGKTKWVSPFKRKSGTDSGCNPRAWTRIQPAHGWAGVKGRHAAFALVSKGRQEALWSLGLGAAKGPQRGMSRTGTYNRALRAKGTAGSMPRFADAHAICPLLEQEVGRGRKLPDVNGRFAHQSCLSFGLTPQKISCYSRSLFHPAND